MAHVQMDPCFRGDDASVSNLSPSFPRKWEPILERNVARRMDPRFRGDDANIVAPAQPGVQLQSRHFSGQNLDPRFRGDDAAVSDRHDASRLALGHPRHFFFAATAASRALSFSYVAL